MEGEANRVHQPTAINAVVHISFIVPSKILIFHILFWHRVDFFLCDVQSYHEFYTDLFPEAAGSEGPIYASQWMTGTNATSEKTLLDPSLSDKAKTFMYETKTIIQTIHCRA